MSNSDYKIIYTTVGEYADSEPDCTGDFVGQHGEILDRDAPITVNLTTREWCAGHDPANATWEPLGDEKIHPDEREE